MQSFLAIIYYKYNMPNVHLSQITRYISAIIVFLYSFIGFCDSYALGFKSFDNTISNILKIESDHKIKIPVVSMIRANTWSSMRDFWNDYEIFSGALSWKVRHITLNDRKFTAKQIANWDFDESYKFLFSQIKKYNIRVIFRTMHEMNGGRYPRSSNPYRFKKAWINIHNLSREQWLNTWNILFDWSVNHRDMPTADLVPSQTSKVYRCTTQLRKKFYCPIMEDYYPGDKYVDLIWFTFYNRWKASYSRQRLSAKQILLEDDFIERINNFKKPIIIDEFATTAVNYSWSYSKSKSQNIYSTNSQNKNKRLQETADYLSKMPNIIAAIYFNVDYTNWLKNTLIWEADRAVINYNTKKTYTGFYSLYHKSETPVKLYKLFDK